MISHSAVPSSSIHSHLILAGLVKGLGTSLSLTAGGLRRALGTGKIARGRVQGPRLAGHVDYKAHHGAVCVFLNTGEEERGGGGADRQEDRLTDRQTDRQTDRE